MRLWVDLLIRRYRLYLAITCMLFIETMLCFRSIPVVSIVLIPIGVFFVAYVPGSLCMHILFPSKSLRGYEHAALSLALSTVIVLTIPFVMASMGIPFFRLNVVLALDVVVIMLMVGSAWRTHSMRDHKPIHVQKSSLIIGLSCIAMFTVVVGVASYNLHNYQPSFYLSNTSGKLTNYPFEIVKNHTYLMELHIQNPTSMELDGKVKASTLSGSTLWSIPVQVGPSEAWSRPIKLPSNRLLQDQIVKFTLSVPTHPGFVRTLWIRYSVVLPQQ